MTTNFTFKEQPGEGRKVILNRIQAVLSKDSRNVER